MALREAVAEVVIQMGQGSVDDILPGFPGFTREQLVKALHNASRLGFIYCKGRKSRKGIPVGSNCAATYYPMPNAVERMQAAAKRNEKPRLPMVSSVFELATPLAVWPKGWTGQVHRPLGEWNSADEAH